MQTLGIELKGNNMTTKAERMQKQIGELEEFLSELEKIGLTAPPQVKYAIEAIKIGSDLALSAEEVSVWLKKVNDDLYAACEDSARRQFGDGWEADDQAYICKAKIVRQWQQRNTRAILYFHDDKTVIRKFWEKFKARLAGWILD